MAKNGNIHPTRIFKTPQELLNAWQEYKKDVDEEASKWSKVQYVGRDGERVTDNPPMPYDLDGFFAWYLNKYGQYIHQYLKQPESYGDDFLSTVTHIKAERDNNIKTGVLTGHFNASMGNRIVGLADKQETSTTANVKLLNINPLGDVETNDSTS